MARSSSVLGVGGEAVIGVGCGRQFSALEPGTEPRPGLALRDETRAQPSHRVTNLVDVEQPGEEDVERAHNQPDG